MEIMDYEKIVKQMIADEAISKEVAAKYFPELTESDDERIRKEIISAVNIYCSEYNRGTKVREDMLAWLEKLDDCEIIRKDWFEHLKRSWYKEGFINGKYKQGETIDTLTPQKAMDIAVSKCFEQGEQKSAWSEEDEHGFENCLYAIKETFKVVNNPHRVGTISWLKSLKGRYVWKPSALQMEALELATENCAYSEYQDCLRELIGQLKKLREE